MQNLDIETFLEKGTFLDNIESIDILNYLELHKDDVYGEMIKMFYLYFKEFTVSFIYDTENNVLLGEQIEIKKCERKNERFLYTKNIDFFIERYHDKIKEIYYDDCEKVIFLNNNINLFYNNYKGVYFLDKITSTDNLSREFISQTMTKL